MIIGWGMERNLAKQLVKDGARYIWQITFNSPDQKLVFTGQGSASVEATLDELIVGPEVVYLPSSSGPPLPYTLTYGSTNTSKFPVFRRGPFSFWPVSYKDGRRSFSVVVVDRQNVIQSLVNCPGGRLIQDVEVDNAKRTITLRGQEGSATFDYETALACYYCCYTISKADFLFLASYLNVTLSDPDAKSLEDAMPLIDCSLCCQMQGAHPETSGRGKRSTGGVVVGAILGGAIGAFGGFLIGGPLGIGPGLIAGSAVGIKIGETIPSSADTGQYQLSPLEISHSLVG